MKLIILLAACLHLAAGFRPLIGGWRNVDPNELMEEFRNGSSMFGLAVGDILKHLTISQNTMSVIVLHKVLEAKQQLVNGLNYNVTLELGHTDCFRNVAVNTGNCNITRLQTCQVKAYQSFDNVTTINWFNCGMLARFKRHLRESEEEKNIRDATEFVARTLDAESKDFYDLSLHGVKEYETVEMGDKAKYRVTAEFLVRSCSDKGKVDECKKKDVIDEVMVCHVEVADRRSSPRFELLRHSCDSLARKVGKLVFRERQAEEGNFKEMRDMLSVGRLEQMSVVEAFGLFKAEYERKYPNEEEESKRMKIFEENLAKARFYQDHDSGSAIYGATPLSDLTEEEFRQMYLTREWDLSVVGKNMRKAEIPDTRDLPKAFDWRNHSAVSTVKNQQSCGSCWAFCVVGNIEGAWAIKHSQLYNLSAQELVDCDQLDMGCSGGLPSLAYEEIQRLGGLETEEDYPYHGKEEVCALNKEKVKVAISGSVNISSNENDMAAWMYKNGPIAIGINAMAMQFYMGGISNPWSLLCPKAPNHGVVIVGYAVKEGWLFDTPYWIIKNSWGKRWGVNGYYLVYRGGGVCGLNLMASSATVE